MLPDFSKEVAVLEIIVQRAAVLAKKALRHSRISQISTTLGSHHSVVTPGDIAAQDYILTQLRAQFPGAHFIAEEKTEGQDILSGRSFADDFLTGIVFVVDGVDGTAEFYRGRHEWSVSVGVMKNRQHCGGAVFMPRLGRGVLVIGETARGAYWLERVADKYRRVYVSNRTGQAAAVFYGVDLPRLPTFNRFLNQVGNQVETARSVGSCALGLAYVAAGKVDALIEPHQSPWDWFGGIPLVMAAGGAVQFYHYRQGKVIPLAVPDIASYSPTEKNVGFIAGNPKIVPWLFALLQKSWE